MVMTDRWRCHLGIEYICIKTSLHAKIHFYILSQIITIGWYGIGKDEVDFHANISKNGSKFKRACMAEERMHTNDKKARMKERRVRIAWRRCVRLKRVCTWVKRWRPQQGGGTHEWRKDVPRWWKGVHDKRAHTR